MLTHFNRAFGLSLKIADSSTFFNQRNNGNSKSLIEIESLNALLKSVKAWAVSLRTAGNSSSTSIGNTSALLDICHFVAKILNYFVTSAEVEKFALDKNLMSLTVSILSGNTFREPQMLKLCAALARYARPDALPEDLLVESRFVAFVVCFVILLDRCPDRPQEVDELLGALAGLLAKYKYKTKGKPKPPSYMLRLVGEHLTPSEMPAVLNGSFVFHGLRNWSSKSLNVRLLVMALKDICLEDVCSSAEDVGRVLCGCRFMREDLPRQVALRRSLEEAIDFSEFVASQQRQSFSKMRFSDAFCQQFCDAVVTLRELDPLFQFLVSQFCEGLKNQMNTELSLNAVLAVLAAVGTVCSAWVTPCARELLSATLGRIESRHERLSFEQVVLFVGSFRCCCFEVPEVEQAMNALWHHVLPLRCSAGRFCDLLQFFEGLSLLPDAFLEQADVAQSIAKFLDAVISKMTSTDSESWAQECEVALTLVRRLPRFVGVLVHTSIGETQLSRLVNEALKALTTAVLPVMGDESLPQLLEAYSNLLRFTPIARSHLEIQDTGHGEREEGDGSDWDLAAAVEALCDQTLCQALQAEAPEDWDQMAADSTWQTAMGAFDAISAARILRALSVWWHRGPRTLQRFVSQVVTAKLLDLDDSSLMLCLAAYRVIRSKGGMDTLTLSNWHSQALEVSLQKLLAKHEETVGKQSRRSPLAHWQCAELFSECIASACLLRGHVPLSGQSADCIRRLGKFYANIISSPNVINSRVERCHVLNLIQEELENIVVKCAQETLFSRNAEAFKSIEVRALTNGLFALLSIAVGPSRLLIDLASPWEHPLEEVERELSNVMLHNVLHLQRRTIRVTFNSTFRYTISSSPLQQMCELFIVSELSKIFSEFKLI